MKRARCGEVWESVLGCVGGEERCGNVGITVLAVGKEWESALGCGGGWWRCRGCGKCYERCKKVCWGVGEMLGEVWGVEKCWGRRGKVLGEVWESLLGCFKGGLVGFSMPLFTLPHIFFHFPIPQHTFSYLSQHFPTTPTLLLLPPPHPNTLFTPLPTSPLRLLFPHPNTLSHIFFNTFPHLSSSHPTLQHTFYTSPHTLQTSSHTLIHLATLFTFTPYTSPPPTSLPALSPLSHTPTHFFTSPLHSNTLSLHTNTLSYI